MNCHSIRRKLPVAGSAGKGSKKIVLFLAALICTVCMTGFTAKAASVEGNVRHSRSIVVQTRETIRVQKIRLKQAVLEKEQEIRRQKIRAKREARKKQEQKKLKKQQELLAALIFCEAGNQPYKGQVAVGAVVLNRIKSKTYPDSMKEVIYQRGQFGPAGSGWLNRVLQNKSYTKTAWKAVADALKGKDPINGCLYFNQGGSGKKIGDHYFH